MKMYFDGQQLILYAENSDELTLLNHPYTQSKLAYAQRVIHERAINLHFSAKCWAVQLDQHLVQIPLAVVGMEKAVFALRLVVDCYMVRLGLVPLHAALLKTSSQQAVYLFGDTNCGKSYISSLLVSEGYQLLGDDHVIAGHSVCFGNATMRIRQEQVYYVKLKECQMALNDYSIVEVNIQNSENCSMSLNAQEYSKRKYEHVLKYLLLSQQPQSFGVTPLIESTVIEEYRRNFQQFVEKTTSITLIEGSPQFIVQSILDLEKNGGK